MEASKTAPKHSTATMATPETTATSTIIIKKTSHSSDNNKKQQLLNQTKEEQVQVNKYNASDSSATRSRKVHQNFSSKHNRQQSRLVKKRQKRKARVKNRETTKTYDRRE